MFDEFASTGVVPKELEKELEKIPQAALTKEEKEVATKSGRGKSDLPVMAELREEADRLGVDISDLGRKRSAIYARLRDHVHALEAQKAEDASPELHVVESPVVEEEPILEEGPIILHELLEEGLPYVEESRVIDDSVVMSDSAVLQDTVDDIKDEVGRVQMALRGIVGYLDTIAQAQAAMVEMFVKDGYLNEGGSLPTIDNNIREDLAALKGIEDRFGTEATVDEPAPALSMPDKVTEVEQSLQAESPTSVIDSMKNGVVPSRDELRALELEELREIAGYLGVPSPHTKVYKQGLIRQIISLASPSV
jgi:hypothetical protein